jgi:hypothetical protein
VEQANDNQLRRVAFALFVELAHDGRCAEAVANGTCHPFGNGVRMIET